MVDWERCWSQVCRALLAGDPDIVAIVQFGSSVYAPEGAQDVDLLVLTKERKDYGLYLGATEEAFCGVDVIPVEVGEEIGWPVALGVRATGRLLYGDGNLVERMVRNVPVPTFGEARKLLSRADRYFQSGGAESDPFFRETDYRTAFNTLFDAARLAAMAFLDTEQTRWGYLRGQLPAPFEEQFREIIDTLHVDYFYRRGLPGEVEQEYRCWRGKVEQFIADLQAATTAKSDEEENE